MPPLNRLRSIFFIPGLLLFVSVSLVLGSATYYKTSPQTVLLEGVRIIGNNIFFSLYKEDLEKAAQLREKYLIGGHSSSSPQASWERLKKKDNNFNLVHYSSPWRPPPPPFVYMDIDTNVLQKFSDKFKLQELISDSSTEYRQMLKLAAWVGTRWDHGSDITPGKPKRFDPIKVVESGMDGKKYWCEIAAEVSVLSASSLGWPSRLVTASRDGYINEHAVAEFWSNQFKKWIMFDTDFNILYEANGIPLSAFELCHNYTTLKANKTFKIKRFAPLKPSLENRRKLNLLPYYNYIHIDMRNDWLSRILRKGSPAGGDMSTWWTARHSTFKIFTSKKRVDEEETFNWSVNYTNIQAVNLCREQQSYHIQYTLSGYSPYFKYWIVTVDDKEQQISTTNYFSTTLKRGQHRITATMQLKNNSIGPETYVEFILN